MYSCGSPAGISVWTDELYMLCDVWDSCPIANQCMSTMQPVLQVLTAASAESVAGSHGEIPCSHGRYGSFVGCPVCLGVPGNCF